MKQHKRFARRPLDNSRPVLALMLASCLSFSLATGGQPSVAAASPAQRPPEPQREQLLNGLKILLLHRPTDRDVVLKLRIHSGAAFDLAGKEGMMALLGDALFPDPATREYVTEELGGRMEVTTGYDTLDITLSGQATQFERLVELFRNALVNMQLTPELVTRLREARVKLVREIGVAPSQVADRAVSTRLFGSYPYGRITAGSPETLARVDRADLLLARERFLNPNNATLTIIGGVEAPRARRTLRQFLGLWRKSDRDVPATFRQPEATDARTLLVHMAGVPDAEVRLAVRGLARSDRDNVAAHVIAVLARERWLAASPELKGRPFFATHMSRLLPGEFRLGASVPSNLAAQTIASGRAVLQTLASAPVAAAELEKAKQEVAATFAARAEGAEKWADMWLDAETYRVNAEDETRAVNQLTAADVQRVAARLFRSVPLAAIVVGDAQQLRAEFARAGDTAVEILGDTTPAPVSEAQAPARPVPNASPTPTFQLKRP